MERVILLCEPDIDSMLTGIYDGWSMALKGKDVRLLVSSRTEEHSLELFTVYEYVEADSEKAEKVARSVRRKVSRLAWELCFQALLHAEPDRADAVYHFLRLAFKVGKDVVEYLQDPYVEKVSAYAKKVSREAQHFWGFLRFKESVLADGQRLLCGRIAPKSDLLLLLAPHFADRFPEENWIIYDEIRQTAALKEAGRPWYMAGMTEQKFSLFESETAGDGYEGLFRTFFDAIAIKERTNPRCQTSMLPLWCRKYMAEFQNIKK